MSKSKTLLKNFFNDQKSQLRVCSTDHGGDRFKFPNRKYVEIVSRRTKTNTETTRSRMVRFEDGTVIKVTYELVQEGN